ncbi:MAG: glycine cleavage system aminomethyltransferase GcvT [Candidatus Thermoplasmatota archaeon]|nr:glycine cleavage system aminomethyltransferase GcvT [Candidatus Thermoplasmatota archaeon]
MRTPIYEWHKENGGNIVDFHGWDLPLYYEGILAEHMAVRKRVGMFDVSHMGDIVVKGPDAVKLMNSLLPSKIDAIQPGKCMYTAFLDEAGLLIDDTIVYRVSNDTIFFVPNAATTETVLNWLQTNSKAFNVKITNLSRELGCFAIQGPESRQVANDIGIVFPEPFTFSFQQDKYGGKNGVNGKNDLIVSGTGYTGEPGFELIVDAESSNKWWNDAINSIKQHGGMPCGLGARDSLRMEKGMLLSGVDFNKDRDPYECSVSFIVEKLDGFMGSDALKQRKSNDKEIFRGFILDGKQIPRHGYSIYDNNKKIGTITSGSISPLLGKAIGLGFIDKKYMKSDNVVQIDIRGKMSEATVSRPKIVP